jgi:hypothetical protein
VRTPSTTLFLAVTLVASCSPAIATVPSGERSRPVDAPVATVEPSSDAGSDASDAPELAQGQGACPAWLPSSHVVFRDFRARGTASFPKGDATCCSITTTDLLCRTSVSAEHVVGAMYGSSLLGIHRGSDAPWLDVPLEVRRHDSMRYAGPVLVRLRVTTTGRIVTLALVEGVCPVTCAWTAAGCRLTEADAMRSCEAVGSYEAGDGRKRR